MSRREDEETQGQREKEGRAAMLELDRIYCGDCLELMKEIPDKSIDMILCDLPYGITDNQWDKRIPEHSLWEQYKRIAKRNAAIVLFATMSFAVDLINSNRKMFRYDLIWHKTNPVGFFNSGKMPLRAHEIILVFYQKLPIFNKIGGHVKPNLKKRAPNSTNQNYGTTPRTDTKNRGIACPTSVLKYSNNVNNNLGHGTQKPLDLCEWLIRSYSNDGNTVLDNCIGSGTTAVAAKRTGRHFIGIELSPEYCEIARKRIAAVPVNLSRFAEAGP
jgi:site-specific DNA-methyltransferase (adenine-specific)